ncbi:DUF1972 domain-containing protein [Gimibacter soli]|uniref:DUF1972 domain-containing protein n=1 Tax=Gimibacter soli TaxID=3024400 RepID=A0AAE9XTY9_9PROT|nr:DUF1972 domain-containing protein [Gimibacter soli]WCL53388.1 DUF1972 domain-containing protein [Gimibacter soli]
MSQKSKKKKKEGIQPAFHVAIIGTVGVPGSYGGFETLAENLVTYAERAEGGAGITVYCSAPAFEDRAPCFRGARRRFVPLGANGPSSMVYDAWSMLDALMRGCSHILLLGVSGALILPLVRIAGKVLGRPCIVTNIDGIEWRRDKWNPLARAVLKASEWAAVRFSDVIVADNQAVAEYVQARYGVPCVTIPYGGDHAVSATPHVENCQDLPARYALAICRIEPENNVEMILEAGAGLGMPLVFVGNWDRSGYGRRLKAAYADNPDISLLDPVYEPGALRAIRDRAVIYLHGHSAGGTNPSLVEMMHFGIPVLAFDCVFNRHTTEEKALFFRSANDLALLARGLGAGDGNAVGSAMKEIAERRYRWNLVGKAYFDLFRL